MTAGMQGSTTKQRSGLVGTGYEGEALAGVAKARRVSEETSDQILRNPLLFRGQTGEQLFPSGEFGLGYNVDRGVRQLGKQLYSLASAGGAARGRLTPEGAEAAASDAITMSLPSLIPQLMQFGQMQFQLPIGLNQYAQQVANQNLQSQLAATGQYGESESKGFDIGFLTGGGGGQVVAAGLGAFGYGK